MVLNVEHGRMRADDDLLPWNTRKFNFSVHNLVWWTRIITICNNEIFCLVLFEKERLFLL
jgi:hypothetical protein